jgi:hypothetical protein
MDIDDPRLAEAHKIMTERVERYDERIAAHGGMRRLHGAARGRIPVRAPRL